jgi:hypothetical protein
LENMFNAAWKDFTPAAKKFKDNWIFIYFLLYLSFYNNIY